MTVKVLDLVELKWDLPDLRLAAGAVGTVAEVYGESGVEVEFLDREGGTLAVLTLHADDVRTIPADVANHRQRPDPLAPGTPVPWEDATPRTENFRRQGARR